MAIEITGRRDSGITGKWTEEVITVVISKSADSGLTCQYQHNNVTISGFKGYAVEKEEDYYIFILINWRKQNRRSITPVIDRVDRVIRNGREVPQSEWTSIVLQPDIEE